MKTNLDEEAEVAAIVNNFISYQLSHYGYKWECPHIRQTTKIDYTLRTVGDDFKASYASQFIEMCKRLEIKPCSIYSTFLGVANELFVEGIKWTRIVALFVFASELANHCTNQNWPQLVDDIAEALASYTVSHLLPWINEHGGWDSSEFISNAEPESKVIITPPSNNDEETLANKDDNKILRNILVTNSLPACNNWNGQYEFDVHFDEKEINTKSIKDWTYSKLKDKLFVNIGASCPVFVHTKGLPPGSYVIRAMAVFSAPAHQMKIVKRCLIHANENHPSNFGHPAPDHLIRCEHATEVIYETDPFTGHHNVLVPYSPPATVTVNEDVMYIYRFMCLGSCVGGINRRAVRIIFTLEKYGNVLGRRVIEVKICACPGRDKRVEEHHYLSRRAPSEVILPDLPSKKLKMCIEEDQDEPDIKEEEEDEDGDDDDDNKLFTLKVHGRETYGLLMKIYNALEISSLLTQEQADVLRKMKQEG